jgi:pyruvate/2-oxoglutarate dehydrogenase complex dihydrolipoamide acyltransferase (E2) component
MTDIRVPQLGEGLREVRIVKLMGAPGDSIRRGDILYVIETDKTTVEMESPFDGRILGWNVAAGDVVPIDSAVLAIATDNVDEGLNTKRPPLRKLIPPRTREYARSKGIDDSVLESIPTTSDKIMPADVDAHINALTEGIAQNPRFVEHRIGGTKRTLIYRLRRSVSTTIPGTVAIEVPWSRLFFSDALAPEARATPIQVLGHAVARLTQEHARFRSILIGDDVIREYDQVNIGIALARPDDELLIAVIRGADRMTLQEYVRECARQMRIALRDGDQATEDTQVLLTHLGDYGVIDAIPTLVAPASSVIFLGAPSASTGLVRVVLTFDHRLINGAAAAKFLHALSQMLVQV